MIAFGTSGTPIEILLVEDHLGDVRLIQESFRNSKRSDIKVSETWWRGSGSSRRDGSITSEFGPERTLREFIQQRVGSLFSEARQRPRRRHRQLNAGLNSPQSITRDFCATVAVSAYLRVLINLLGE
jgi:hypothetical protein